MLARSRRTAKWLDEHCSALRTVRAVAVHARDGSSVSRVWEDQIVRVPTMVCSMSVDAMGVESTHEMTQLAGCAFQVWNGDGTFTALCPTGQDGRVKYVSVDPKIGADHRFACGRQPRLRDERGRSTDRVQLRSTPPGAATVTPRGGGVPSRRPAHWSTGPTTRSSTWRPTSRALRTPTRDLRHTAPIGQRGPLRSRLDLPV